MVFTKSNPRLGKTASSKIFQLNGASSRHEQEKEYYLTETTGHCYCLVPVECLYTLLTEWGHLINSKMNGEHPRKIIALLSPHRKIHMNVLKRKKKLEFSLPVLSAFLTSALWQLEQMASGEDTLHLKPYPSLGLILTSDAGTPGLLGFLSFPVLYDIFHFHTDQPYCVLAKEFFIFRLILTVWSCHTTVQRHISPCIWKTSGCTLFCPTSYTWCSLFHRPFSKMWKTWEDFGTSRWSTWSFL